VIDVLKERLYPLRALVKIPPLAQPGRKHIHVATVYRWMKHGLRGVRLEGVQCGGNICSSVEAVARFFAALTDAREGRLGAPVPKAAEGPRPSLAHTHAELICDRERI
jgi:hypothetical protein